MRRNGYHDLRGYRRIARCVQPEQGAIVQCLASLIYVVVLRLSLLLMREPLAARTVATLGIAGCSIAVASLSVVLEGRLRATRAVSACVAVFATLSCTLQVAKVYFAGVGHRDLIFDNHVLVNPLGSLAYFNVPLVLTYTADIVLWAACLLLSVASAAAFRSRASRLS